jgi:ribonuclease HII
MTPTELATWLTTNDSTPLTPEDRATLATALTELAVSQSLIAKQSILLDSHNADQIDIESTLRQSLAPLTDSGTLDTTPFDFEKSKQARAELARKLTEASTLRSIIAMVINMVHTVSRS